MIRFLIMKDVFVLFKLFWSLQTKNRRLKGTVTDAKVNYSINCNVYNDKDCNNT